MMSARQVMNRPPNPTWADIKQLSWAAMLVIPFIALGSFGAARLVGAETALWVFVGLTALVVVAFTTIVVACLLVSFSVDAFAAIRSRLRRSPLRRARGHW